MNQTVAKIALCEKCGSESVCLDANVTWDKEAQRWNVADDRMNGFDCLDCDHVGPVNMVDDPSQPLPLDPDMVMSAALCLWEFAPVWLAHRVIREFGKETEN